MAKNTELRIINNKNSEFILKLRAFNVPRVGDDIRLSNDKFYKVVIVVWLYDNPKSLTDIVNVGVISIDV